MTRVDAPVGTGAFEREAMRDVLNKGYGPPIEWWYAPHVLDADQTAVATEK
jgi:hypothetical protein